MNKAMQSQVKRAPCALISVMVLLCFCSNVNAKERDLYSLPKDLKDGFAYIVSAPSRLDKKSAAITLGIIGAGAAVYTQDAKIREFFQRRKGEAADNISSVAEKSGNGVYDIGFLALYGGSGFLTDNEKMQDTALHSFEAFVVANTFGAAIKAAAGRSRPELNEGSGKFSPASFDSDHTSFPSGHTVSAFSIASVFAGEYDSPWVGRAAYGIASMAALQRIYSDNHWASDVFAGAVLGTAVGKGIVWLHRTKGAENIFLIPAAEPGEKRYGLTVVVRF
ncbi:MAG: phosphatase PAP2 family protein [Deltaproteobacteria bacterium]|nr:phosphatase PAP2 family protein [Deltaproteobacteria bacterium]